MRKIALSLVVVAASGAYVWSQSGNAISDNPLGPLPPLGPQSALGPESPIGPESRNNDIRTGSIAKRTPVFVNVPADTGVALQPAVENEWSQGEEDDSEVGRLLAAQPPADTPLSQSSPTPNLTAAAALVAAPDAPVAPLPTPLEPAPGAPDLPAAPPPAQVEARLPRPRPAYQAPQAPVVSQPVTRVAMNVASNGRFADGTFTGPIVDAYYGLIQIQAVVQSGQLVDINALRYPSDRRLSVRINRYALPILREEVISAQSANVDIISGATFTSEAFIRSLGRALRAAGA